jgi:hypothetical protein
MFPNMDLHRFCYLLQVCIGFFRCIVPLLFCQRQSFNHICMSVVVSVEGPWNCIPLVRFMVILVNEQFEDTKVLIRNRNSTDKQSNNKEL